MWAFLLNMNTPKLSLYYYDNCPFCRKIIKKLDELNIYVQFCNILKDQAYKAKLINDTGKKTVPVLYIDNNPLSESSEISKWLDENKSKLTKK